MTHLITCLPDDLLGMVGEATEKRRMDIWRGEHKTMFAQVLAEWNEEMADWEQDEARVGRDLPDVEHTIWEDEVAEWRAQHGEEEDIDFCLDNEGGEWIDGRTIMYGAGSYGGAVAMRFMEEFQYRLRNGEIPVPRWLEQVRQRKRE